MKKRFELIDLFGAILISLLIGFVSSVICFTEGYKKGQVNAMDGIYSYKADTTITIKYVEVK